MLSISYIIIGVAIFIAIIVVVFYFLIKKRKKHRGQAYLDNDNLLRSSFRGMKGNDFENFVADVYSKLGYQTEKVGGSGDGGIDIIAKKDNKKYIIQCKDWNSNKANPDDVSRLHSAVYREQVDKGIFVAVSGFTTQAMAEFDKESKMELVDGQGIIDLYKKANQG